MVTFCSCLSFICPAQTNIEFSYDASGNRYSRAVITSGSVTSQTDSLIATLMKDPSEYHVGGNQVMISYKAEEKMIQVDFSFSTGQGAIIELNRSDGKQIMKKAGASSENKIDLSNYPLGSYLLTISIGEEKKTWKITRI